VLAFLASFAPAAHAAKKRVGVSINGMPAGPVRAAVGDVLKKHGFESVSPDLSSDSDDAIASAARQSRLVAVVVGEVREGGKRLKLRVYGASGDLIGEGSWSEAGGPKKLAASVERTLWARVGGSLSKAQAARPEKAEKPARAEPEVAEEAPARKPPVEETPTYSRSSESDSPKSRDSDEAEPPRKRGKKRRGGDGDDADTVVAKPEGGGGGGSGKAGTALDLGVSFRPMMRSLSWNSSSTLSTYSLGLAPSLGATVAWYPAAHFMSGWQSNLGVLVSMEYTPGLSSERGALKFPTQESDYMGGVRGRLIFGPVEAALTLGGGQHAFIFTGRVNSDPMSPNNALPSLPDVKYTYGRAGLDARITLPAKLALMLGGGYRAVLSGGSTNYLLETAGYLPNAKVGGFDVTASLGYRLLPVIEARAGFDLRRYSITAGTNGSSTTSGTDQYVSVWAQLAVMLDGTGSGGASDDDEDAVTEVKPARREKREKAAESDDEE
jgi:hypothetical protein